MLVCKRPNDLVANGRTFLSVESALLNSCNDFVSLALNS